MEKLQMEAGKRYRIILDDCCIEGHVEGVFIRYKLDDFYDDNKEDQTAYADAIFDIGVIGPMWGQWTVELLTDVLSQQEENPHASTP